MLYKKNTEKVLSDELFANPTSEYRCTPFWAWNCKLEQGLLDREIDCMKEMGFGGFHMHSRTGLATPYLSEEYFDRIKGCIEKAKSNNMLAWLYDEDRWPSGAAGGIVTKDYRYRAKRLVISRNRYENCVSVEEAKVNGSPVFVAAYDVVLASGGYIDVYQKIGFDDNASGIKYYAYICTDGNSSWFNGEAYVDTLSKEAIDKFIEVTHEAYLKNVGEEFNNAVPAIFTDEPQFSQKWTLNRPTDCNDIHLPWTFDFADSFKSQYGYDIFDKLPELFQELRCKASVARYHYHDHICQRFTEAFADNCGKWCSAHNISLTGHMMNESCLASQTVSLGEAMRSYRSFGIPGIDMLCNWQELNTAKQAQSAVHQFGREGMLSELYGVTDWDFDFRGHKFQGDWQAALGVTVRVPHLFWASMEGEAKRDYPASIGYQSPWYKKYSYIENHFARVNTAMTRGTPNVSVGMIHPIESYWLHFGPSALTNDIRAQKDAHFAELTKWLLSGTIDFDFISESLLPEQYGGVESGKLSVGKMKYETIIIPECETLRRTTLNALIDFHKCGGKIVFIGKCPELVDAVLSDDVCELYSKSVVVPFDRIEILKSVDSSRTIGISGTRDEQYVYQLRDDNDCKWLFIAHLNQNKNIYISRTDNLTVKIKGCFTPLLYDTLSGKIEKVNYNITDGYTYIERRVYSQDSLLFKLTSATETSYALPRTVLKQIGFERILNKVSYRRDEPNVLLLDFAEYSIDGCQYYPADEILRLDNTIRAKLGMPDRDGSIVQPWVFPPETPEHRASLKFTFDSEVNISGAMLACERVDEYNVTFNNVNVNTVVNGYWVDESMKTIMLPDIVVGKNELIIDMPFGKQTNTEWCYILGEFNVRLEGFVKTVVEKTDKIGFQSVTTQGMPFYSGNISYDVEINAPEDCKLFIKLGAYFGAIVSVSLDGKLVGDIAFEPYTMLIPNVSQGKHTLTYTLYGNRFNSHGGLHSTDREMVWAGPNIWHTGDALGNMGVIVLGDDDISLNSYAYDTWSDEYRLRDMGIVVAPNVFYMK